jgi:16S rRNA (adenine1518-N6/adenine1519-N6)-dimethyltransferase
MGLQLTSPRVVRDILAKHGLSPNKKLGQNFLVDDNFIEIIGAAAALDPKDNILEIGPGLGTLTTFLAKRVKQVVAVEIDHGFIPVLTENLAAYSNVQVVCGDILKLDLEQYFKDREKPLKVVANLPYYITSPVIMRLFQLGLPWERVVVMVQREVAHRMVAKPGGKDYGLLSLAVQYYTIPEVIKIVPAAVFYPRPDVDSAIIRLLVRQQPPAEVGDEVLFFRLLRGGFRQRRKTLLNSLRAEFGHQYEKTELVSFLEAADIDPGRRGETLTLEEFARLSKVIAEK